MSTNPREISRLPARPCVAWLPRPSDEQIRREFPHLETRSPQILRRPRHLRTPRRCTFPRDRSGQIVVALTWNNLGRLFVDADRHAEAMPLLERAVTVL